jgi:hypothetical protein
MRHDFKTSLAVIKHAFALLADETGTGWITMKSTKAAAKILVMVLPHYNNNVTSGVQRQSPAASSSQQLRIRLGHQNAESKRHPVK